MGTWTRDGANTHVVRAACGKNGRELACPPRDEALRADEALHADEGPARARAPYVARASQHGRPPTVGCTRQTSGVDAPWAPMTSSTATCAASHKTLTHPFGPCAITLPRAGLGAKARSKGVASIFANYVVPPTQTPVNAVSSIPATTPTADARIPREDDRGHSLPLVLCESPMHRPVTRPQATVGEVAQMQWRAALRVNNTAFTLQRAPKTCAQRRFPPL